MVNEQIQPHCALCITEEVILSLLKQYNNYEGVGLPLFTLYISLKEEINWYKRQKAAANLLFFWKIIIILNGKDRVIIIWNIYS